MREYGQLEFSVQVWMRRIKFNYLQQVSGYMLANYGCKVVDLEGGERHRLFPG